MLLVRSVTGPGRARIKTVAVYRATSFNLSDPTTEDKKTINWVVESDGQSFKKFKSHGDIFRFDVPSSLIGKTIRVMPYLNSPTPRVSVVTSIIGTTSGDETSQLTPKMVRLEREGARYFAIIDEGPRFYVGSDVGYLGTRGLMNTHDSSGTSYHPEDSRDEFGFWADFIYPTAICESEGYFQRINTYDRARFTFGFFQYAAHTPNDNFVLLLRELLGFPIAKAYFPDLILIEGAIHRQTERGIVRLETADSTDALMDYLNPSKDVVDEVEVINAAKFIHWSQNDSQHRHLQVTFTIDSMKKKMNSYSKRYGLHGVADKICLVIADIRHQGRAKSRHIISALESDDALGNLLRIGEGTFDDRIDTLRSEIERGEREGNLDKYKYDQIKEDFVLI